MNEAEVLFWQRTAKEFGLDIEAPIELTLANGARMKATALVRCFGAAKGMVVDPDYRILEPHTQVLVAEGYGYSAISSVSAHLHERANMIDVFADWGWTGKADARPVWLPPDSN